MTVDLRLGDNLAVLPTLDTASVDAVVTDPPYGLEFMGRDWDHAVPGVDVWAECLRVLRPGGHLLAFGGTRTAHRLTCAIEDAGFEIRDTIMWVYGSGMPKGQNVGKAIDRMAGAEREVIGQGKTGGLATAFTGNHRDNGEAPDAWRDTHHGHAFDITAPATPEAAQWEGWNTSLKPSQEPIIVARKPLTGTVAANVMAHGTGALNVGACRVERALGDVSGWASSPGFKSNNGIMNGTGERREARPDSSGRWPANVVLSHDGECVEGGPCVDSCPVAEMDRQSGTSKSSSDPNRFVGYASNRQAYDSGGRPSSTELIGQPRAVYGDEGGASRFFPSFRYQAKAPSSERPKIDGKGWPTVKPLGLMRWLVRLVTPPGGLVLDPFAGTGPTLQAAQLEGFHALGVERDEFAYQLACQRLGLAVRSERAEQDPEAAA